MKIFSIVSCSLLLAHASAQNLVPNGSFEEYTACPPTWGYLDRAVGWGEYVAGSPDFFHECNNTTAGVPWNDLGYQYASHGLGYMGLATYSDGNPLVREYATVNLIEPMEIGVEYQLSFKMAVGGFGMWNGASAHYTASGVGFKFFVDRPIDFYGYLFPNSAALRMEILPTDTAIWYTASGMYVPDSAYTQLVVGNLFENQYFQAAILDSTGFGTFPNAYAFIDECCVSANGACGFATSVSQTASTAGSFNAWFSPELHVRFRQPLSGELSLELYDVLGALAWSSRRAVNGQDFTFGVGDLAEGLYYLRASNGQTAFRPLQIVR